MDLNFHMFLYLQEILSWIDFEVNMMTLSIFCPILFHILQFMLFQLIYLGFAHNLYIRAVAHG
jgi:hypothetical protein